MSTLLAQARLQACSHWPFASHAILSMVPVAKPGLGTLAVDQHWRLYYDETALARYGIEHSAAVILHELDHLLKRHHKRARSVVSAGQWETWNDATDAAINCDLREQGIPLPEGAVYPELFNLPAGLSAEEYFRSLLDQANNQPATNQQTTGADTQADGKADGRAGSAGQTTAGSIYDVPNSPPPQSGSGTSTSDAECKTESCPSFDSADTANPPDCKIRPCPNSASSAELTPQPQSSSGSCSDGQQRPWELGPPDDANPGLDEADQEQLIHVTAKNVLERQHGQQSAGHRRWAESILNPPIDPAAKLLNLVRRYCDLTVGIGERSFRRPNRRNSNPRMALAGHVAPLPRITVIIDTSGTMDAQDIGLALGLIRKVLNSFRIRDGIKVVTGDTKGQTQQLCLSDPRSIELKGGGGTNMAAIVTEVLQARPQPQMILICTDGYTPWPEHNPGLPVVACLTNRRASLPDMYQPPSWIPSIELAKETLA